MNVLNKLATMFVVGLLAACSGGSSGSVRSNPQDLPYYSQHAYDKLNACMGRYVREVLGSSSKKLLLFIDRARTFQNPADPSTGNVSHAGREMLITHLRRSVSASVLTLPMVNPRPIEEYFIGGFIPSPDTLVQSAALSGGANVIYAIKPTFSGFDTPTMGDGTAGSGGYDKSDTRINAAAAENNQSGLMQMDVHVGTILPNSVVGAFSLKATVRRESSNTNVSISVSGINIGFTREHIVADGVHNVQSSMTAVAAFEVMRMLLPDGISERCMAEPGTQPTLRMDHAWRYEAASRYEKFRMLQTALNAYFGDLRPRLQQDGLNGQNTRNAIDAARRSFRMLPMTEATYGQLYVALMIENERRLTAAG